MFNMIYNVLSYILPFILTLTVLIFVHEMGHYLVARLNKVRVEVFSIGFGKEIFGWNDKVGTRWKICFFPLGGYVKFFGDMGVSSSKPDISSDEISQSDLKFAFHNKGLFQRASIVVAGPGANFLFAIALFTIVFYSFGQPVTSPVIDKILPDSSASNAGLQEGDKIIKANKNNIRSFEEIRNIVQLRPNQLITLVVLRNNEEIIVKITPKLVHVTDRFGNKFSVGQLGITSSNVQLVKHDIFNAFLVSINSTFEVMMSTLFAVKQIIIGDRGAEELSGPIGIAKMTGDIAQYGVLPLIQLAAFLSISIGLVNLFPIPMLDGGHLMFYFFEAILGKPLNAKVQDLSIKFGLILVLALFVFTTFNDLHKINIFNSFSRIFG
ncbi:RIP metalloprotease RseP [Alphaproteobacteria bacterium]|nr:RIP metalloprotease RseP [Alphaproteobacteria bacterium]